MSEINYLKDKKCPNCGKGWIIDHGDFLECEDCGCEVDAKCDACGTPLRRTGNDHICCENCGGYEGYSKRQTARYKLSQADPSIEEAQKNLDEVIRATRGC